MLKYKLIEENSEYITYAYYPEGREHFGVVKMRKKDEEVLEKKISKKRFRRMVCITHDMENRRFDCRK